MQHTHTYTHTQLVWIGSTSMLHVAILGQLLSLLPLHEHNNSAPFAGRKYKALPYSHQTQTHQGTQKYTHTHIATHAGNLLKRKVATYEPKNDATSTSSKGCGLGQQEANATQSRTVGSIHYAAAKRANIFVTS